MLGVGSAALLMLTLAALFLWRKRAPKVTALLMLGVGAGLGGLLGSWLSTMLGWGISMLGTVLGAGAAACVFLVLGYIVLDDLWPRHKANKMTAVAALLLVPVAVITGGSITQIATGAGNAISRGGESVVARLF